MKNSKTMRGLGAFAICGIVAACSASGSSGGFLPDGGPDEAGVEPDAGPTPDAKVPDAKGKDTGPSGTGPIVVKNLSYGGTSLTNMDITFGLTGSADIDRISSMEFQFDGDTVAGKISVTCSDAPWNQAASKVQTLLFSYASTSTYYVKYPCGFVQESALTTYAPGFGTGFGGTLSVTFKGLLADATPWSVTTTGAKR